MKSRRSITKILCLPNLHNCMKFQNIVIAKIDNKYTWKFDRKTYSLIRCTYSNLMLPISKLLCKNVADKKYILSPFENLLWLLDIF